MRIFRTRIQGFFKQVKSCNITRWLTCFLRQKVPDYLFIGSIISVIFNQVVSLNWLVYRGLLYS